jgi:phytanoyl-CoA dioxygenase PhyH
LSSEEHDRFERDGYLVFDPEIAPDLIERVLGDADAMYRTEDFIDQELGIVYGGGGRPRIIDGWKVSENVRRLARAPKVLAVCEELYGRKPLPFQTLNFPVGTEQRPHADSMHFDSDPTGYMCGVWIALEDMDMDNGPLIYFPGSQELPVPTWEEVGRPADEDHYPHYEDPRAFMWGRYEKYESYVQTVLEGHGFEARYGTIKKGEALLWSANLIHGGSPQRDNERTRHSQVTHYYFEGCRYHTPMRAEGDRRFWRYPWWVRDEGVKEAGAAIREAVNVSVPPDAALLVLDHAEPAFDLNGRSARLFPVVDDAQDPAAAGGDSTAIQELENLNEDGPQYLLVPRYQLGRLMEVCNNLQQHLESKYPAIVRDGGSCAIYDLRPSG